MGKMHKHFVTFFSPGTLVAEETTQPIDAWDVHAATALVNGITERYGATPYGFQFTTRGRSSQDLDSRVIKRSPLYWLGGTVETLAEVKARATEKDRILIANMEGNGYDRIITNTNSWRWTQPLGETDIVLDYTPPPRAHVEAN